MSFTRQEADKWHQEIPGARWFKADLHVHTIDDRAGGRAKLPDGLSGNIETPATFTQYARLFLQGAVANGVQVIALTPHSPRFGASADSSAVWTIVEEWNDGTDDDGVPFREKIYAVFPGFEPSLNVGREGLHLLFLFDPEIGRDCYLRAFDLLMGGVAPWQGNTLQMSSKRPEDTFDELRRLHDRVCPADTDGRREWQYLVLAPHIDAPRGLLGAQKAQPLQLFEHGEIAGLELGDEKLPDDTVRERPWLVDGMREHRQAFFHSSDAYAPAEIGRRHTWIKLASPRIEALRQSFVASDSRMRLGFCPDESEGLRPVPDPPDVNLTERRWLKSVAVRGGASFFGAREQDGAGMTRFDLSPDLTCIIGGSMTGKSTLLDGLRVHVGAPLPQDPGIRKDVEDRGQARFLAGSPEVELECPGSDPTAPQHERWPAVFFAQNELQRLAKESTAVEEILTRLVLSETHDIEHRRERLADIDKDLGRLAKRLADLDERVDEAEQAHDRARRAKEELSVFSEAGVGSLHEAGRARQAWEEVRERARGLREEIDRVLESARGVDIPSIDEDLKSALAASEVNLTISMLAARTGRISEHLKAAKQEAESWEGEVGSIVDISTVRERDLHVEVERNLAALGLDAGRLKVFQALNQQASLLSSYEATLKEIRSQLAIAEQSFTEASGQRANLVCEQRRAFDRVISRIKADFDERILANRIDCGDTDRLEKFLIGLAQRGVTRWWNGLEESSKPSPETLVQCLDEGRLDELGMTPAVQETFRECMTKTRRRELTAIRCPDRYVLKLRLDDGSDRRLDSLSGGQRVSVLLSLLLETVDDRPLVIDQPEDELDNRFLFETVLPALKKLKGRRQIIVATHDANIVVNGDADMVIQLEATANHGHVAVAGAIEEPAVRRAIVRTVDGGDEAFRLRHLKYGF